MTMRGNRYTPEEYYRLEQVAEGKSDYFDGQIFSMAGGTAAHSRIATNIIREVDSRLEGGPCVTYNSDLRLNVSATGLRTYPDVTVFCEELTPDPEDPFSETYVNPTVIFEVLSKTTEAYDRGFRLENFLKIESLRAYVLVSQSHPHVEIYERQGDKWEFRAFNGLEDVLKIPPLGIEVPLAGVYRAVEFPPSMRPFED